MPKNEKQKLKLIYLARILLEQTDEDHKMGADALLAALEAQGIQAERKSIYSDILALQDLGMDIILQRGRGGGYYVASRDFELAELKLLVDAIQCSRFITEKKSNSLIRKIESLASRPQAAQLQRQVYVTGRIKTMNESIYYNIDKVHEAISAGCQISFLYFEWHVDFSQQQILQKRFRKNGEVYSVSPWALTWDDEKYYLVAYAADSGDIRHYRVDKMEHITILDKPREGLNLFREFNVATYTKRLFGMFSGKPETIRLLCENRFSGVIRDQFGADLMLQPVDDEHFSAFVTVVPSPQFFSWIFGLEGGVKITAPDAVCARFQQQLRSQLE